MEQFTQSYKGMRVELVLADGRTMQGEVEGNARDTLMLKDANGELQAFHCNAVDSMKEL